MSSANSTLDSPVLAAPATEMAAVFRQLQRETLRVVLIVLAVAGLALMGLAGVLAYSLWAILAGTVTLAIVGGAAWLEPRSFLAAAVAATVASLFVVLVPVYAAGWTTAIVLLAAPVGLVTLAFGIGPGAAAAGAATVWLALAPPAWLPVPGTERLVAGLTLWLTWGLIWLTLRPLLTAVEWSWLNFERSRTLLEESRQFQLRLQQTLQDLTEANMQLTRVNRLAVGLQQEAEEERLAKQQFVANVSHELRTPINMVIGFSEMILKAPETYGSAVPRGLLADLEVILRNSQHLASLIDDVLDLSQIEAGKMALVKERVDLREIVDCGLRGRPPPVRIEAAHADVWRWRRSCPPSCATGRASARWCSTCSVTPAALRRQGAWSSAPGRRATTSSCAWPTPGRADGRRTGTPLPAVPTARQRRAAARRHGTGAQHQQELRRAARRQDVGGERAGRGHELLLQPAYRRTTAAPERRRRLDQPVSART